jgi:hypothetical protein
MGQIMLQDMLAMYGIGNNNHKDMKYHIFMLSKTGIKIFFTEDGDWTEDVCLRAESSDFMFVYQALAKILEDEGIRAKAEASFLF